MTSAPEFETRDVNTRSVIRAALFLVVAVGLLIPLIVGMFYWLQPESDRAVSSIGEENLRAGPRLESNPAADGAMLQEKALARIEGYGWADRSAGRARVPIERAMALVAKQGWPDKEDGGGPKP